MAFLISLLLLSAICAVIDGSKGGICPSGKDGIRDCEGLADGNYQQCYSCHDFALCVGGHMYADRPCPGGLVWDTRNGIGRCEWTSNSCRAQGFTIRTEWGGKPIDHQPVALSLSPYDGGVKVVVRAPFFNDPPSPGGVPGQPFPQLWNYEVVELFLLNNKRTEYLEVELCPHGEHLVLLLRGVGIAIKQQLPLQFSSTIFGNSWIGEAYIPESYLPARVTHMNAFAIHGSGEERVYESLYPVPHGAFSHPNFHRLEYFKKIDFSVLSPENMARKTNSEVWDV